MKCGIEVVLYGELDSFVLDFKNYRKIYYVEFKNYRNFYLIILKCNGETYRTIKWVLQRKMRYI